MGVLNYFRLIIIFWDVLRNIRIQRFSLKIDCTEYKGARYFQFYYSVINPVIILFILFRSVSWVTVLRHWLVPLFFADLFFSQQM